MSAWRSAFERQAEVDATYSKSAGQRLKRTCCLKAACNWLRIMLTLLALYITLALGCAYALAKAGWHGPADVIYTLYSPFCHQFAFRSIFIFGEQPFYPRGAADSAYTPFEEYAAQSDVISGAVSPLVGGLRG